MSKYPYNWPVVSLRECGEWLSGGTPSKENPAYWNGDISWISAKSMYSVYVSESDEKVTDEAIGNGTRVVPARTILILVRGSMLFKRIPICITVSEVSFNQDVKAIVPYDGVLPEFLLYALIAQEATLLSQVEITGMGAGKLSTDVLENLPIHLPPLEEQRKIAEILSTWDEAIALTEALVVALGRRKQALMQVLLTGEVRFQEFEGEWEDVLLGEAAFINPPKPSHINDETDVSFITMADVSEDARLMNMVNRKYSEVKNGFTGFQDRDVLIAKITPCFENGKGALIEGLTNGIGFGSTEFHVARANPERIIPEFIYYHTITHNFRGNGEANMSGSAGQKRVPTEFIRSYRVFLPPLDEQQKITDVLAFSDIQLDILREMVSQLQNQKRGLMQQLLTGAVRV